MPIHRDYAIKESSILGKEGVGKRRTEGYRDNKKIVIKLKQK